MSVFKADRSLASLTDEMRKRTENFLKLCKDHEINIGISETGRTVARQRYLYSFGRVFAEFGSQNKDKGAVTWTLDSNHLRGEAIDIYFDNGGNIYNGPWSEVYDYARQCGLSSLFDKTGYDRPHLEFDHEWKPPINRRAYEDFLFNNGIISVPGKDLDQPCTREETYKIVVELFKKQQTQLNNMKKDIRNLRLKLK